MTVLYPKLAEEMTPAIDRKEHSRTNDTARCGLLLEESRDTACSAIPTSNNHCTLSGEYVINGRRKGIRADGVTPFSSTHKKTRLCLSRARRGNIPRPKRRIGKKNTNCKFTVTTADGRTDGLRHSAHRPFHVRSGRRMSVKQGRQPPSF